MLLVQTGCWRNKCFCLAQPEQLEWWNAEKIPGEGKKGNVGIIVLKMNSKAPQLCSKNKQQQNSKLQQLWFSHHSCSYPNSKGFVSQSYLLEKTSGAQFWKLWKKLWRIYQPGACIWMWHGHAIFKSKSTHWMEFCWSLSRKPQPFSI